MTTNDNKFQEEEKLSDLDPDVILSFQIFAPNNTSRNVLTVYLNGRVTFSPAYNTSSSRNMTMQLPVNMDSSSHNEHHLINTEAYLQRHLPVEAFMALQHHYYENPLSLQQKQRMLTTGAAATTTSAKLFLCVRGKEHWLFIGNYQYGREGDIPVHIDANMYKAVLKLEEYLTEG